ncbi:MAG: class III poly(R)-hydroxyalkanoic acid synthase subunit PhaC [Bernardetiaceae bacterium]
METQELIQKVSETFSNAMQGYQNLLEVKEIDVATAPRETVWSDGKVELLHFKNDTGVKCKTPLLIVYALVNRWKMMDLQPDRSFIRKLLSEGIDIYLLDTGYPSRADRYKTMDDYINGNIHDAIEFMKESHGIKAINLLGVCQGGTFSLIYTALHPQNIKNLITMITPFDFHIEDGLLFKWAQGLDVDAIVDGHNGLVPNDFLDTAFNLLKPMSQVNKAMNIPNVVKDKGTLMNFLRMEKWVNDGPSQAGETYRQFIKDMYQENKLAKGEFVLDGQKVDLKKITMPLLNIYAKDDHIVPPSASKPINDMVSSKDKELFEFPGGHIGVYVGSRSQKMLAPAVAKWLTERDK